MVHFIEVFQLFLNPINGFLETVKETPLLVNLKLINLINLRPML